MWEETIRAITNQKEVLGRRGIDEGIGEGFPMLGEHATVRVSDFDSIIRNFVV